MAQYNLDREYLYKRTKEEKEIDREIEDIKIQGEIEDQIKHNY